jgi:hypothetical protein
VDAGAQKKTQPVADAVATFELGILGPGGLDYETSVGLILNGPRVERRRAFRFVEAGFDVLGGSVGKEWFEALSADEEEANALFNNYRVKQQMARGFEGGGEF